MTAAPDLETAIARLRELVEQAGVIVPFTGAGISTECGIPDFRSPGGIWTKMQPIEFGRLPGEPGDARRELAAAFRDGGAFRRREARPRPSGAREPLPAGQGSRRDHAEYRQSASGSGFAADDVIELHGNTTYATCLDCAKRYELSWVKAANSTAPAAARPIAHCGGYIKTATVSFGQSMPRARDARARKS